MLESVPGGSLRQLFPRHAPVAVPESIYDDLDLEPPPGRPLLFINMVASLDGRAQVDGRSAGLGSIVDGRLMRVLRARADCVLNGAGTVQAENVYGRLAEPLVAARRARGQADEPLWAAMTGSGDLPMDSSMLVRPTRRPIVFVAEATPAAARQRLSDRAEVAVVGALRPEPAAVLEHLHRVHGCRYVLLEGGPTINRAFFAAGLVDELFLTLAPRIVGGPGLPIVAGAGLPPESTPSGDLVSLFYNDSELFLRYRYPRSVA